MRLDVGYNVGAVSSIAVNGTALLNSIAYRPLSPAATNWRWGNGSTYSRTFDNDGRVTSVSLGTVQRTYTYDPNGQVTGFTDQGPAGTKQNSFTYDEAGQLTGYSGSVGTGGYSYDANGNRLSELINGIGRTYTYFSGTNRIASVTNEWTYAYNADGNPTTDGSFFNFTYDSYGRVLTAVSPQDVSLAYTYNGLGQRVSKTVKRWQCSGGGSINSGSTPISSHASGQTLPNASTSTSLASAMPSQVASCSFVTTGLNQYVYDDAGHMIGEYDNVTKSWQETIWFNGQPVATMQPSGLYYINADNIGTPRSIVRASDNLEVWRWDSDPFGSTVATNPTSVALTYNLRFPGQYLDVESSTHYNGMRDYRPQTGRYLQADPIGLSAGTSRYAYVQGNPLRYADPGGLWVIYIGGTGSILGGGLAASSGGGFVFDSSGKWGTYTVVGVGGGGGGDASFGLSIGGMINTKTGAAPAGIDDFGGPFVSGSSGLGLGPHGSIDGFYDPYSDMGGKGGGVTVGAGVGGGASGQATNTTVTPNTLRLSDFLPNWLKPSAASCP